MSRFPNKESGEEWAAARGYLAGPPETPKDIEEQKQKRIEFNKNRKERNENLSETFNTLNQMYYQVYYCYNCYYYLGRKTEVNKEHNFCGYCGHEIIWPTNI